MSVIRQEKQEVWGVSRQRALDSYKGQGPRPRLTAAPPRMLLHLQDVRKAGKYSSFKLKCAEFQILAKKTNIT
jgi:hypothetical protein